MDDPKLVRTWRHYKMSNTAPAMAECRAEIERAVGAALDEHMCVALGFGGIFWLRISPATSPAPSAVCAGGEEELRTNLVAAQLGSLCSYIAHPPGVRQRGLTVYFAAACHLRL